MSRKENVNWKEFLSRRAIYVECKTADEVGRALAAGYAVTTTAEVAAECGAEFEHPDDVEAMIESHLRPYGDQEPPPGPVYPEWTNPKPD